jgi:hypothetical protein
MMLLKSSLVIPDSYEASDAPKAFSISSKSRKPFLSTSTASN